MENVVYSVLETNIMANLSVAILESNKFPAKRVLAKDPISKENLLCLRLDSWSESHFGKRGVGA
jgi:hypothetical protein